MKKLLFLVMMLLSLAISFKDAQATTWWVDPKGGGNCSTATGTSDPGVYITSIQTAIQCVPSGYPWSAGAGAGHTVIVKAGTYSEYIDVFPGGTGWNSPFTIKRNGTDTVILQPPTSGSYYHALCFCYTSNAKYIIWDGITVDAINVQQNAVSIADGANHIRITDSTLKNAPWFAVIFSGDGSELTNNLLDNNSWDKVPSPAPHAIYNGGSNTLIHNNIIQAGVSGGLGYGIQVQYAGADNTIITNNRIHNYVRGGIIISSYGGIFSGTKIRNNIIHGASTLSGISLEQGNTDVYNNTVYQSVERCISVQNNGASDGSVRIKNNLLIGCNGVVVDSGMDDAVTQSNNYTSGVAADHFVNAGAADFHLLSSSNAIDYGTDVGLPYFGSAPDAGAFEFESVRYVSPSGSGTTCSSGNPCSVTTGLSQTGQGDTLRFQSGVYNQTFSVSNTGATLEAHRKTIISDVAKGAIFRPSSPPPGGKCIINAVGHYITIDGFTIDGALSSDECGIATSGYATTDNTYITIKNNTIQNIGSDAITNSGSSYVTIDSNIISNVGAMHPGLSHGTYVTNYTSNFTITNNVYSNSVGYCIVLYYDAGSRPSNFTVTGNKMNSCGESSDVSAFGSYYDNVTFRFNSIKDGGDGGILIREGSNIYIDNNTSYSNVNGGIQIEGGSSITCRNNLLIANGSAFSGSCGTTATNITTGTAADHFINAGANDLRLKSTSAARDAGTNIGFPYKGSAPDVGYAEYEVVYYAGKGSGDSNSNSCTTAQTDSDGSRKLTIGGSNGLLSCLLAGDTGIVRSGTYSERIAFDEETIPSGTVNNRITVQAAIGETVTIQNPSGSNPMVDICDSSYITFKGFVFDANHTAAGVMTIGCGSKGVWIEDSEIKNATCNGILVANLNTDNNVIRRNRIHNNGRHDEGATCFYGYGIYSGTTNLLIEYNDVYANGSYGIHVYSEEQNPDGHTIRYNRVHDNQFSELAAGIIVFRGGSHYVHNNIIYNERSTCLQIGGWGGTARIYNNTCYNSGTQGLGTSIYFDGQSSADGSEVKNNLIVSSGGINFFPPGGAYVANLFSSTPTDHFIDHVNFNFGLKTGSSAINVAVDLGPPYNIDIVGTSRPQGAGWDIGAYEFTGGGPGPQPCTPLLVASYSADGNANDSTGTNHGSLGTGVSYASGKYGQAWSMTEQGGITVPDANPLDFTNGFSLGAWIYPTAYSSIWGSAVIAKNPDSKYFLFSNIEGYCGANNIMGGFSQAGNTYIACYSTPPTLNQWQYLEISYDGSLLTLRKDGNVLTTSPVTTVMDTTTGTLQIGTSGYDEHFNGMIDNVRIYNCGISLSQHISDMNSALGTVKTPIGLKVSGLGLKIGPSVGVKIGGQ